MRKATLLFALLTLLVSGTAAQSSLQLGVGAGAAITTLTGSDTDGAESRTSIFIGASLVVHKPGSLLGFETGLFYVPKGATTEGDGFDGALEITYFEIPALLRLGLKLQNSNVMPVLLLGGSLGIKSGCKVSATSGTASVDIDCDDSSFGGELDLKSLDLGISVGAGVDIPIGTRAVLAPSLRYTRGLSDIGDTSDNADAKNSAFQIGAAFRLKL